MKLGQRKCVPDAECPQYIGDLLDAALACHLKVRVVASILGVSHTLFYRWRDGTEPAENHRRRILYLTDALQRLCRLKILPRSVMERDRQERINRTIAELKRELFRVN